LRSRFGSIPKYDACSVKSVVVASTLGILAHGLTRASETHCTGVSRRSSDGTKNEHTSGRRSFTSAEHALLLDCLGGFAGRGF
jgi:hypothetical protein